MNRQVTIGIAVMFVASCQIGMSVTVTSPNVNTQMQKVQVISTDQEASFEVTESVLNNYELLHLGFEGDQGGFGFEPGAFTAPFAVDVDVSTENSTVYLDDPKFAEMYSSEAVTPIGPLITIEVPYNAFKNSDDPSQRTISVIPVLYKEYQSVYEATDPLVVEVRIMRSDNSQDFSLEDYVAGGLIAVLRETIHAAFAGATPPHPRRLLSAFSRSIMEPRLNAPVGLELKQ